LAKLRFGNRLPRYTLLVFFTVCIVLGIAVLYRLLGTAFTPSLMGNVTRLFEDDKLVAALENTFWLFVFSAATQITMSIAVTIYVDEVSSVAKILLVLPFAMGVVAPGFSVLVFFSTAIGPLEINVLGSPLGSRFAVVFVDTWQWLGILLVACFLTVEQIPKSYYEQAQLEGIARFRRWWLVSRPELQRIFLLYAGLRLVDWLRKVDIIKALSGEGGPGYAVETLGMYIVKTYFQSAGRGYATFLTLLQVVLLGSILGLIIRRSRFTTVVD